MQNKIFQYKIQIESSLSLLHYYMSQELICTLTQTSQLFKMNAEGLECKKTRISQLHYITLVISILRLCCCCSCNRTRGATKGQRTRHCFLLEKRKQLDLFSRAPFFWGITARRRTCSQNWALCFACELEQRCGEADSANGCKDKW